MAVKRVLVTGASRGIGRAIALKLASDGWQVAIHYNSARAEAESLAFELGNNSSGIYSANFSEPDQAAQLWGAAKADGQVDALVNNAGIYIPVPFTAPEIEFEAARKAMFAVNFESPLKLIRSAVLDFATQGGGTVVNVASRVGFRGEANASMYAASKAALINLTRSLAVELAKQNITIIGIAPGWVDTSMARDGMQDRLPSILETIPLGRMASPEDCAEVTAFLLRPQAKYLSGVVVDINGASYFH